MKKNKEQKITLAMINGEAEFQRSQTFVEAQRNYINAHVKYYNCGSPPQRLNGMELWKHNILKIIWMMFLRKVCKKRKWNSIQEIITAASFISEKIDIVFVQFGTNGAGVLHICKQLKLPLIVHFHGFDASVYDILAAYKEVYRAMFDYAEYIIVVSKAMKERLITIGADPEKIILNPCAPNDTYFDIKPAFSKKLFVGAGRFVNKKAPHITILAFEKILGFHPDAKLILMGTGELWDICNDLVRIKGLQNNIELPGPFSSDELKQVFVQAVALVQHSVTALNGDMEGTPVVCLEASAAGLPVISTFHAGIPDVIIDGKTGLLVKERDIDDMAEKMRFVLEHPEGTRVMGKLGRENIREHFSMTHHIEILNEIIFKCMEIKK
jgi:glycosyltransferase involved in cell wall biosynthesis